MGYLAELETNFRLGKLLMNLWIGSSNLVEKGLKDKGHLFRYAVLALERVHLRDTDPQDLVYLAGARLTRSLTLEECQNIHMWRIVQRACGVRAPPLDARESPT
ncbi:MAG: hypothetical protein AMJ88_16580 [Anaerolineae bacterium SM23_ 63]|nr:MAG: hypothetical protein AMJ88_16580 [Anaerolineae bacterium SM23_ 63]